LTRVSPRAIPRELHPTQRPAVLFFGLLRPYKGLDVLLDAWRQLDVDAELWIVGRPRMDIAPLVDSAPRGVRWVPRYVSDYELAACFCAAQVVVLPYVETERLDFSGVLATALAFGSPSVVSDVGGFGEVAEAGAARLVPPGDPTALAAALSELLSDEAARGRLAEGALLAASGPYSWAEAARRTLALYGALAR
jgi:glycosyltransferase involved in cell wall biosynthesis